MTLAQTSPPEVQELDERTNPDNLEVTVFQGLDSPRTLYKVEFEHDLGVKSRNKKIRGSYPYLSPGEKLVFQGLPDTVWLPDRGSGPANKRGLVGYTRMTYSGIASESVDERMQGAFFTALYALSQPFPGQ